MKLAKLIRYCVSGGIVIIGLVATNAAQAVSLLSTDSGEVGAIDTSTGIFTPLITGDLTFTDIALTPDDQIFGVTFNQLYTIEQSSNTPNLIGNLSVGDVNGLAFNNNQLFGSGSSSLYSVDSSSGSAALVAENFNFFSSGDIVFDPVTNQFLATSSTPTDSTLFSINPTDGNFTQIGAIGFANVFGLFFENETLFGYTANGLQLIINSETGEGIFDKNVTGTNDLIFGATSTPVPEPTTMLGLLAFSAGAGFLRKRSKQKLKV